jgi:23S rRNA pseudouridine1911/1915/1917 synthase
MDIEKIQQEDEIYEIKKLTVDPGQDALRIDKFIVSRLENATRNKIQQGLEQGLILVNDKPVKPNYKVRPNDEITLYSDEHPSETDVKPEDIPLDIQYEDDSFIILHKPVGLVVHPGSGNYNGTLLNGIAFHLQKQFPEITEQKLARYGLVHRIDKNTSGLMVVAKTDIAIQHISKQFFHHTIQRKYVALVWGNVVQDEGTIVAHVGRSQTQRKLFTAYPDGEHGKHAITHYKVLERMGYVTLIECVLETGRTHQIRVHMKYLGHPLFNDETYGGDRIVKGTVYTKYKQFVENCFAICSRHALHAKLLGLVHPVTQQEMIFDSALPNDMQQLIDKWRKYSPSKNYITDDVADNTETE